MSGLVGMATPGHRTEMQTIADIELGSFASEFDAEAEEEKKLQLQNGGGKSSGEGGAGGLGGPLRERMVPEAGPSSQKSPQPLSADLAPSKVVPSSASSDSARRSPLGDMQSDTEQLDSPSAQPKFKINSRRRNVIRPNASDIDVTGDTSSHPSVPPQSSGLAGGSNFPQVGNATRASHEGDSDDLMSQSQLDLGAGPSLLDDPDDEIFPEEKGPAASVRARENDRPSSRVSQRRRGTGSGGEAPPGEDAMHIMTLRKQQTMLAEHENVIFGLRSTIVMMEDLIQGKFNFDALDMLRENMNLKNQLQAKIQDAADKNKMIRELQAACSTQDHKIRELMAELKKKSKVPSGRISELEGQLKEALQEGRRLREANEDLEDENSRLRDELDQMKDRSQGASAEEVENLQRQLDDADRRAKRSRDELDEKDGIIDDLRAEISALTDERDQLIEDLETKALESERNLGPKIEQLETTNLSLQDELEHHKSRLHTHVTERTQHVEQITRLREEVNKLNAAQSDMHRTASRADNLQFEADSLDRAVRERDEEIRRLKEDIDRLMGEHHEIVESNEMRYQQAELALVNEARTLEALLHEAKVDVAGRDADLNQLADDLATCENNVHELEFALQKCDDEKQQVLAEMKNADTELQERDRLQADLSAEVNARDALEQELDSLKLAEERALEERELAYAEVDSLSRKLADLEERHRADADNKRKALEERDDLSSELRRTKNARDEEVRALRSEMRSEIDQLKRTITDKEQTSSRLQHDIESARGRILQRDRDINDLQAALQNAENNHRQLGDEHTSDKVSLEMESERLRRNLKRNEADLANAHGELDRLEAVLRERESEIHELTSEKRALEQDLTAEGQDRLALSDKLDQAAKAAKQYEPLIATLKQKVEDLQRRLYEESNALGSSQRRSDSSRKDANDLLHTVFQRVSKISGLADVDPPPTLSALKDKLLLRLRAVANAHADFEKQLRAVELRLEAKVGAMGRELDAKKRLLDSVEVSVQKMSNTKIAWKAKLAMKEDELNDAKARAKDLQSQLASARISTDGDTSKERASLSSRASSAEKRVILLSNQLTELQTQVADHQTKHSDANSKWEDRVREYEKRLKAANERVKAEKQGGKERARQLEETVKSLQDQIRATNARSDKLQSVLNAASIGSRRHDPDAL